MVMESKYTSLPQNPFGLNMAALLTKKLTHMPMATGKSMLMVPRFKSRQADVVNTSAEKNITGKVNTQAAQRNSDIISDEISVET